MERSSSIETPLTVVILTLNEARHLPACLAAIPELYSVLVVDSGSMDRTLEIARSHGCRVVQNPWPGFAAQRNFALEKCDITSKWVLFADADEIFPPEFFTWFTQEAQDRVDFDVGEIASILFFKRVPLKHAPGYPIYHPRLVRRGHAHFVLNHTGHGETANSQARRLTIDIPYAHYFFDGDLQGWLTKHVKLALLEVHLVRPASGTLTVRARINLLLRHARLRVPARFFYHYVVCRGFRDGRHGLEYSLMYTWFEFTRGLFRFVGNSRTPAP
jgi:glycosyltransferase involved in cell wall biosynthesis